MQDKQRDDCVCRIDAAPQFCECVGTICVGGVGRRRPSDFLNGHRINDE